IYSFYIPTRIVFGADSSKTAGVELRGLGGRKALVVTDKGIEKAGLLKGILESLDKAEMGWTVFNGVEPNPTIPCVEASLDTYRREGCDCLLAVGGGSSMDTAKATGVLVANGGKITDYEGMNKVEKALPPYVAVPTTCGTGAEATYFAVITDPARKFKFAVGSDKQLPRVALVDPLLLVNLPGPIVASTGMDALTHAVESYLNIDHQPICDALDLQAIKMIGRYLRPAVANGNLEAIANMVLASTIAGMGFTITRVTIVHAMSHPISAHAGVPHGVANAILLPYAMEWNVIGMPERYADIAQALGEDTYGLTTMEAAHLAVEAVRELSADVGIPRTIGEVGISEEMLPILADDASKSGTVPLNPRRVTRDDLYNIYKTALG
ncbi:MAG: iron-containing alcohol dehydrogenase, partial [Dehalococcoidales bacterium]|nr:iron-containing alcohol dehydrogenase [Dehalococcoidales bacterium]